MTVHWSKSWTNEKQICALPVAPKNQVCTPTAVTEINDHADFCNDFHESLRYENIQMLIDETVKGYRSMSTFYIQSMLVFRLIFGPMW